MAWARFDDDLLTNDKYQSVGVEAKLLWHTSIIYCAKNLTDGCVRSASIPVLGRLAGLTDVDPIAHELLEAHLWDEGEGGISVHDYLEYNPSREEVLALRAARSEAGARGGHNRASNRLAIAKQMPSKPLANAKQNASKTLAKSYPGPGPGPGPGPNKVPGSLVGADAPTEESAPKFDAESRPYKLALYFRSKVLEHSPRARVPRPNPRAMARWSEEADKLLRIDKRPPEEVKAVIDWCQADEFWRTVVFSMAKLREKYDGLDLRRRTPARNGTNGKDRHTLDDWLNDEDPYMRRIEENRRLEEAERAAN